MPRIRDKRGQNIQELAVTPWMTKKGLREGAGLEHTAAQSAKANPPQMYSVLLSEGPFTSHTKIELPINPTGVPSKQLSTHAIALPSGVLLSQPCSSSDITEQPNPAQPQQQYEQQQQQPLVDISPADASAWHQVRRGSRLQAEPQLEQKLATAAVHHVGSPLQTDALAGTAPSNYQQHEHDSDLLLGSYQSSDDETLDSQEQQQQQDRVLQGFAQLLLHPSGAIAGHFIASSSSGLGSSNEQQQQQQQQRLCLGLQGRQVLGLHSCYRDPEWALLQLSVVKYSSSSAMCRTAAAAAAAAAAHDVDSDVQSEELIGKRLCIKQNTMHTTQQQQQQQLEAGGLCDPAAAAAAAAPADADYAAEAWVQRTGGDLVTLQPADMEDEDTAAAIMKESLGLEPSSVQVHFTPHTLLSGAAAVKQLASTWPSLAGSSSSSDDDGLVVNLGQMVISNLPVGMFVD